MNLNREPLDSPPDKRSSLPHSGKLVVSAGAGVASMIIAVLLLARLTEMDDDSGVSSILILLLVLPLGIFVPIGMFIRSVLLLLKRQNATGAAKAVAVFLTSVLGIMLLALFLFFVLYIRADREPPF